MDDIEHAVLSPVVSDDDGRIVWR